MVKILNTFSASSEEHAPGCHEVTFKFYSNPIRLDKDTVFTVGVRNLFYKHAIRNITSSFGNNKFYYTGKNGVRRTLTFPNGVYEASDINRFIQSSLDQNGDFTLLDTQEKVYDIQLGINKPTGRFEFVIKPGASVDFTPADTFRDLLGFNAQLLTQEFSQAPNGPNIQPVNELLLHCDIIDACSINNSKKADVRSGTYGVYQLHGTANAYICADTTNIRYAPVRVTSSLSSIRWWFTDRQLRNVDILSDNEFGFSIDFEIIGN